MSRPFLFLFRNAVYFMLSVSFFALSVGFFLAAAELTEESATAVPEAQGGGPQRAAGGAGPCVARRWRELLGWAAAAVDVALGGGGGSDSTAELWAAWPSRLCCRPAVAEAFGCELELETTRPSLYPSG